MDSLNLFVQSQITSPLDFFLIKLRFWKLELDMASTKMALYRAQVSRILIIYFMRVAISLTMFLKYFDLFAAFEVESITKYTLKSQGFQGKDTNLENYLNTINSEREGYSTPVKFNGTPFDFVQ